MTVSSSPFSIHRPAKRKYGSDSPQIHLHYYPSSPSLHASIPVHEDISPRIIKKLRPKPINPQSLKGPSRVPRVTYVVIGTKLMVAKTVRELFQGQRNLEHGDVDIEMQLDDAEHCSFCESAVDTSAGEEEYLCLGCGRTVCGKCGVRQYLSSGDYVACLDCVHQG